MSGGVFHEDVDVKQEAESEFDEEDVVWKLSADFKVNADDVGEDTDCNFCAKGFKTARGLKLHLSRAHEVKTEEEPHQDRSNERSATKEREYKCDQCDKVFTAKSYLPHHMAKVHNTQAKNFKCKECDFKSAIRRDVRSHYSQVHLKPAKCTYCSYACPFPSKLEMHIKTKHLKLKDLKCKECPFETSRPQNLRLHVMSVHEKKRPHACHLCDYAAAQKGGLREHLVRYHSDFKVKCGICGDSFVKSAIRAHVIKEHPIVKPEKESKSPQDAN